MEWLNFHHLYYFWVVAKEGSVTAASRKLRLAQPTVSVQLSAFENTLGQKLFNRSGRNLTLTDTGRMVYRRADEIFSLGRDLVAALRDLPPGASELRLNVGIADSMPKLLAHRLLEPLARLDEPVFLACRTSRQNELLAMLSIDELDLVLSDAPLGQQARVRAFNHPLGECGLTVLARGRLAQGYRDGFPGSLNGAPFIMPAPGGARARLLRDWFDQQGIQPRVVGECDDSALLKMLGQDGLGLFAMPTVEEEEVMRQYQVRPVGRLEGITERFYAISTERRIKHPAVRAITEAAHSRLFS